MSEGSQLIGLGTTPYCTQRCFSSSVSPAPPSRSPIHAPRPIPCESISLSKSISSTSKAAKPRSSSRPPANPCSSTPAGPATISVMPTASSPPQKTPASANSTTSSSPTITTTTSAALRNSPSASPSAPSSTTAKIANPLGKNFTTPTKLCSTPGNTDTSSPNPATSSQSKEFAPK